MPQSIQIDPNSTAQQPVAVPSVGVYDRMEPRPRKDDFERVLRAEIRDALWMLTRQWQFGEFKGEDTGSPIFAKFKSASGKLNAYKPYPRSQPIPYTSDTPLEPLVEGEMVPLDLAMRIQIGHFWFRLLDSNNLSQYKADYISTYILQDPNTFTDPVTKARLTTNPELMALYNTSYQRICDGGLLYQYLKAQPANKAGDNITTGADKTTLDGLGTELMDWFRNLYTQPDDPEDSAWNASRLEYRFDLHVEDGNNTDAVLSAEEYYHGKLDWYSVDKQSQTKNASNSIPENRQTLIMSELEYAGMPHPRYWQFEDGYVNLGDILSRTTDIGKILLSEFSLIYGNDWSLVPLDVPVGSYTRIDELIVKDVFGHSTRIQPAGKGPDDAWQRWRMYNLNTVGESLDQQADNRLFLPPTLLNTMESDAIEEILFVRDEMANMIWGIEKIVPDELGGGQDGFDAARRLLQKLEEEQTGTPNSTPFPERNDANIRYGLLNTVPENWIPFIPVNKSDDINNPLVMLQRAAMPRLIEGMEPDAVRPRTHLLTEETPHYFIHEEEVPRSGVVITRRYQRVRWYDGRVYVWVGRQKQVGRGEGNSRLKFDQISYKE